MFHNCRYEFTHVIHMAAQAGVRYSLKNPLTYVKNNVQCQMVLINALKKFEVRKNNFL